MENNNITAPVTTLTKEEKKALRKRVLKETLKTSGPAVALALVGGVVIGVIAVIASNDETEDTEA